MSEDSVNSVYSTPSCTCYCGLNAKCLTAWTRENAGRRFFKCARSPAGSCGYWAWLDEDYSSRAKCVIFDLKIKAEAVRRERDTLKAQMGYSVKNRMDESSNLKETMAEMDCNPKETATVKHESIGGDLKKISVLEEKVQKLKLYLVVCCGVLLGFITAKLM